MVGDRTWLTIRIGDHEILVNVDRWELDDAIEDLEDESFHRSGLLVTSFRV